MTHNAIDDESEHLFGFEDMNAIRLNDNDLMGFILIWESTLARVDGVLDKDMILKPMWFGLIKDIKDCLEV